MSLIILMSVSGSICMVFSMLQQRAERRFSLYKWQDLLLKMALFLYLVPLPAGFDGEAALGKRAEAGGGSRTAGYQDITEQGGSISIE